MKMNEDDPPLVREDPRSILSESEDSMSIYLTRKMINIPMHDDRTDDGMGLFARLRYTLVDKWQRRKMTVELQDLDDRMLADIGLFRDEIPSFVAACHKRKARISPRQAGIDNIDHLGALRPS